MASTEKIRTWIEHTLPRDKLENHLNTIIAKPEGGSGYQGISDHEAALRIV